MNQKTNKFLIISDVDGTVNKNTLSLKICNRETQRVCYANKEYDGNTGLIQKCLQENPNIQIEFISNGTKGRRLNEHYVKEYFDKELFYCSSIQERRKVLVNIIENNPDVTTFFFVSDTLDDLMIIPKKYKNKIHFIGSEQNFDDYFIHFYSRHKYINPGRTWVLDFNRSVLLVLISILINKCPLEDTFSAVD